MSELATYAFACARVSVQFEAPGFSAWLDEVLHPAFTRVDPDERAVTVVVRRGAPGVALPRPDETSSDEDAELRPWFTFDREVVSLPSRSNGPTVQVIDDKYGASYVVHTEPLSVDVHADGPWPRTRAALLRVVRELAVSQVLAGGQSLRLHASGVERDGRVVLFAGPKGAGKTTLLAHLAATTDAAIVTNDCAFVTRSTEQAWDVHPVPISISVRPDTLIRLPALFHDVADVDTLMQYTRDEAAVALDRHGRVTTPRRLRLSPALFAHAVQGRLSPGGRLVAVAMLANDEQAVGSTIREVPTDEARSRLPAVRYGLDASAAPRTVFAQLVDPANHASAEGELVSRLAAEVPCLDVRVGPDVLAGRDAACDLLDRLLAA